ncbi:hypothetical protein [Psychromonas aquimarina]|uniref:hypothetical protein n=1 Tax=Psychromonas aquimarina TaxID=444919 RepID=UPI00048EEB29|nr:hypothetical protein [Psychromonas aquimarina]
MGLVLGPLIIFWLMMGIYSLKMGYSLLTSLPLLPDAALITLIAVFSLLSYIYLGLERFKASKKLYWCDIPLFFTANKTSFFIFLIAALMHWFGSNYLEHEYIRPVPFIIVFTISFGALAGTFSSEAFMNKYNIVRTH